MKAAGKESDLEYLELEELPEVQFFPGSIAVGDLADKYVGAQLLHLVVDNLQRGQRGQRSVKSEGEPGATNLVNAGARGETVPGVVEVLRARHQVDPLRGGLEVGP